MSVTVDEFKVFVKVPGPIVPFIIGPSGTTIKKLKEEFSVGLAFLGENTQTYRERDLKIFARKGDNQGEARVFAAKEKVLEMMSEFAQNPRNGQERNQFGQQANYSRAKTPNNNFFPKKNQYDGALLTGSADFLGPVDNGTSGISDDYFLVPSSVCDEVFGRDLDNLKKIKKHYDLLSLDMQELQMVNGKEVRRLLLRGRADKIDGAKKMIQRLVDKAIYSQPQNGVFSGSFGCNVPSPGKNRIDSRSPFQGSQFGNSGGATANSSIANGFPKKVVPGVNGFPRQHNSFRSENGQGDSGTEMEAEAANESSNVTQLVDSYASKIIARQASVVQLVDDLKNAVKKEITPENGATMESLRKQIYERDQKAEKQADEISQLQFALEKVLKEKATLEELLATMKNAMNEMKSRPAKEACHECHQERCDIVFMPCKHMTHCKRCADEFYPHDRKDLKCPICHKKIDCKLIVTPVAS